ncbi:MAG: fatty acid desaturase [Gemmobacter sp.]
MRSDAPAVEWPTLLVLLATYGTWLFATSTLYAGFPVVATVVAGLAIAQFSSLQHETLHGHPFRSRALSEAMVFPGLTLTVPYGRFRDTHLAHHHDPVLTDPYDDPESNFLDPAVWNRLSVPARTVLRANNTVLGRMVIGPLIGNALWLQGEARLVLGGDAHVRREWLMHLAGLVPVVAWLWVAAMPWWAYVVAAWIGHGMLKLRTYLEHRAHDTARARTVVIEDRGPLALLFLNNNFHVVHHMHPGVPWYRLPGAYHAHREHYLRRNDGYVYRNYLQVIRAFLLRAKDPVPHPLWTGPTSVQATEGGHLAGIIEKRHPVVATPAE